MNKIKNRYQWFYARTNHLSNITDSGYNHDYHIVDTIEDKIVFSSNSQFEVWIRLKKLNEKR